LLKVTEYPNNSPPLYLSTVRGINIKEIALFGWLPFLAADIGR
jgi:hypothetical protein